MKIVYTNGSNQDFCKLCNLLDDYLNEIVGGEIQRKHYNQYNLLHDIHDVVLIYEDELPIACGGFKHYHTGIAEIKRVFVCKEHRGKGVSKELMRVIEEQAKSKGYNKLILETGAVLIEAMGLYRSLGYHIIPNYGQYADMSQSICMEKNL